MLDFILDIIVEPILEYFSVPAPEREAGGGRAAGAILWENIAFYASMGCFLLTGVCWKYHSYLLMTAAATGMVLFAAIWLKAPIKAVFRSVRRWLEERDRGL